MIRFFGALLFACLITPVWSWASAGTDDIETAMPAPLGEADHELLRGLMAEATDALNKLDANALRRHLAEGFVLTFADQSVVTDPAQLDGYIDGYFNGADAPLKSIEFVPEATEKVRFIDTRTGVVHGTSADSYTLADDSRLVLNTHWTATVVKQDGQWLIQSFHAGVNMLDNPILEAAGQSGILAAGIGLLAGILLGVVLMRVLRRT